MTRYLRQDPIDGWHHVTNHAVGSEDLFLTDQDRHEFVRRMHESSEKYGVVVVAFCLMGNHFHLVVYCPSGRLAQFMHYLESTYAREFNVRHGRRGKLYSDKYDNVVLSSEGQAVVTIRYVHRNPLELGIDIRVYPWSSYLAYVEGDESLFSVSKNVLENLLGGPREHRLHVQTDAGSDETRMAMGVRKVYRSTPDMVDEMLTRLCELTSLSLAVSVQEIVAPRSKARNDARLAVTLIAYESRTGFAEEIRAFLGYRTASALRSAANRGRNRAERDPLFRRLIADLRSRWVLATEPLAS